MPICSGRSSILGSATPSFESYHKAISNEYILHTLNNRINNEGMPKVSVIDMRNEYKMGNMSIFSETLIAKIHQSLKNKKQVLLFINRRGMSTFVSCRDCGYVVKCPNCDLPLTFHYNNLTLQCHHCNYSSKLPTYCPTCKSLAIKYFGTGTERVEQELKKILKEEVSIGRMDKDTTQKRESHDLIYQNFSNRKVDVLIGIKLLPKVGFTQCRPGWYYHGRHYD